MQSRSGPASSGPEITFCFAASLGKTTNRAEVRLHSRVTPGSLPRLHLRGIHTRSSVRYRTNKVFVLVVECRVGTGNDEEGILP